MEENSTSFQLIAIIGVIWAIYLVVYLFTFLFPSQETRTAPPVSSSSETKKTQSKAGKAPAAKVQKEPNLHEIVPAGKFAYCKFCKVYMEDDEFLRSHENGKKHQKNCRNPDSIWYRIMNTKEEEIVEEQKFAIQTVQEVAKEVDDGWTL